MCKLVKWHPSITVSPQWLNVLMMRGEERREERERIKDKKEREEKSFDSRKLTAKLIPFDSHQWLRLDGVWRNHCLSVCVCECVCVLRRVVQHIFAHT